MELWQAAVSDKKGVEVVEGSLEEYLTEVKQKKIKRYRAISHKSFAKFQRVKRKKQAAVSTEKPRPMQTAVVIVTEVVRLPIRDLFSATAANSEATNTECQTYHHVCIFCSEKHHYSNCTAER